MKGNIFIILILAFAFMSCGHRKDAKSFETALETQTGEDYEIVKLHTKVSGYVVYKNKTTGKYEAYNMDKWDRKTMTTFAQFQSGAAAGTDYVIDLTKDTYWVESGYWQDYYETEYYYYDYYDEYCDCYLTDYYEETYWAGEYWVDTSHYVTDYYGGGFTFSNTASASKDLETMAALKEEVAKKFVSYKLKSEFSLSANRADELAGLVGKYQKLENSRELTASEKDHFAMKALGVSMTSIEKAIKAKAEGSEAQYTDLLESAAQVNQTTPEQIGKFFEEFATDGLL